MSNRIIVDGSKAAGNSVLEFINTVNDSIAKGRRLKAQLDSMASGSDWDQVAVELGLPKPGDTNPANTLAQDAWTVISTAIEALDGTTFVNGSVTTKAALAELERLDQG